MSDVCIMFGCTYSSEVLACLVFAGRYVRLFSCFVRWVVWCGGLLWLVVSAVVYRYTRHIWK